MQTSVHALPVLQDNIIWIWVCHQEAVVVDPAIAAPVERWLQDRQLNLIAILQTHHHADHIGGTPDLLKVWPAAEVVAARADRTRIPFQTVSVKDGDRFDLFGNNVQVFDVAAHTAAHIAFFIPEALPSPSRPLLFCGDTLFSAGCGRLFEGTPAQMHRAMRIFDSLPDDTLVCCAHEYTEGNLRWALEQRPTDSAIEHRYRDVQSRRSRGELSLPSSIAMERLTNLFMRAESVEELAALRHHKDHWRAS